MSGEDDSYYDILEVPKDAPPHLIKKQWRAMAKKYHPDKLPDDKKAWGENKIKQINEAYEILSDPEKRKMYDQYGKEGPMGGFPGGFPGMPNMDEIFGNMFGGRQRKKPDSVSPVVIPIEMTLEEIFKGKKIKQSAQRYNLCKECEATGFADKLDHKCPVCKGKKVVVRVRHMGPGMIQQTQMPCQACQASGKETEGVDKCPKCYGLGMTHEEFTLELEIPAGVKNGFKIKIPDQGNKVKPKDVPMYGSERGEVIVQVVEKEHSLFRRGVVNGNPAHLQFDYKVSLADAICGFTHSFKHLDGRKIAVVEENMIKDGEIRFLKGEGMPNMGGQAKRGDLFIRYQVETPPKLTGAQKDVLYKLLTGKAYKPKKVGAGEIEMKTIPAENYGNHKNSYESSSDDEEEAPPGCATQ